MSTFQVPWTGLALVCIAIVAAECTTASAQEIKVVSPPSLATVEGDIFIGGGGNGPVRSQLLFLASDFAQLPASHRQIVAFNFRADASQGLPNNWTWPNVQIWMSTTNRTSLSNVFEDNRDPNRSMVFDGSAVWSLLATGPAGGPKDFADGKPLDTPFFYDPSQGNLLVETASFEPSSLPTPLVDFQSAPVGRTLISIDGPNNEIGILVNRVPVMRFQFIPEPSTFALVGVGLFGAGLLAWRRKIAIPPRP